MTRKRLDVAALHSALDYVRAHRRISWRVVADETGLSASTFTRLGQGHAPDADGLCTLMAWLGPLPLSRFTVDAEPIEYDATNFGDLARGVRVYMRPDGSSREEPLEGEKFWWPTDCARCDKPIGPWSPDRGPAAGMTHIVDGGGPDWETNRDHAPTIDSCTCTLVTGRADPDCPVHHGRRARGPKPPPVGPGCVCDGSGRNCPRHGAVI